MRAYDRALLDAAQDAVTTQRSGEFVDAGVTCMICASRATTRKARRMILQELLRLLSKSFPSPSIHAIFPRLLS